MKNSKIICIILIVLAILVVGILAVFKIAGKQTKKENGETVEQYVEQIENFTITFEGKEEIGKEEIYNFGEYKVYQYNGIVRVKTENEELELKQVLNDKKISKEKLLSQIEAQSKDTVTFKDGGTMCYANSEFTAIKYNVINGSTDLYIGVPEIGYSVKDK